MLRRLLDSLLALDVPDSVTVFVVVIDNDADGSARELCEGFAARAPWDVSHEIEERRGIPIARNRAIAVALERGADLIAFVDDDETVDPQWLAALYRTRQERRLHLVGGPVRAVSDIAVMSSRQRAILRGTVARYTQKETKTRRLAERAADQAVVLTNNWLADAHWLRSSGLRFDERNPLTGGSDALFFHQAKALGARSGWAPTAVVYEAIPESRLTFRYQVMRARDQSTAWFYREPARSRPLRVGRALIVAAAKTAAGIGWAIALPVAGGTALVQCARMFGGAWGLLRALAGGQSALYRETDGY
jgi:glycosyltransferase involved in cell wall biosynthesis